MKKHLILTCFLKFTYICHFLLKDYKRFRFIAKEIGFSMPDCTIFQHADSYCIYKLSMRMSTRNNLVNIDPFKVNEHGKLFQIFMK